MFLPPVFPILLQEYNDHFVPILLASKFYVLLYVSRSEVQKVKKHSWVGSIVREGINLHEVL